MRASIATVSLAGSLEEKLEAAAAAGFEGVEIFDDDLIASTLSPEEVGRRVRDLGMRVELFQPFRDFEGVSPTRLAANLRRAAAKLDIAARLGAPVMLVCSNVATAGRDDDELAATQLRELGDLADQRELRIAYEALAWGRFVSTYDHAWSIVQRTGHPAVGLGLDSFHMLARGSSLDALSRIPGERIFFAQVADAPLLQLDPLSWSRHHRLFPGQGDLDLTAWTSVLAHTGYDGPLSIEVFNDVFRQTDPARTAMDGMRSLRFLEDRAAPAPRLTALEPGGEVINLARVEISLLDDEGLDPMMTALGYVPEYSPEGTRWFNGHAELIICPASGQSGITGVSFHVRDPAAAARRADALSAPVAVGHGEGGAREYLGPTGVRMAFSPDEGSLEAAPDIDHVSLPCDRANLDAAVLFCRSVLGLNVRSSQDVPDVRGLVLSEVLASHNDRARLVLNVPPAGQSSTGHVAFAVTDVFATVRDLTWVGVQMLHLPANYYDDLAARFDLPMNRISELQTHGVMYDRDDHGEFFQAYSRSCEGLFFEFVQRSGTYRGFGAANSPVRRAAQNRSGRDRIATLEDRNS